MPEPSPTQPVSEDSQRVRFAKREVVKILTALERVDQDELDAAMRVLRLEDELADARELAARWRKSYEAVQRILETAEGDRAAKLDRIAREWIGKA